MSRCAVFKQHVLQDGVRDAEGLKRELMRDGKTTITGNPRRKILRGLTFKSEHTWRGFLKHVLHNKNLPVSKCLHVERPQSM